MVIVDYSLLVPCIVSRPMESDMPSPCPSTVSPELLVFAALARRYREDEARAELGARRAAFAALAERSRETTRACSETQAPAA